MGSAPDEFGFEAKHTMLSFIVVFLKELNTVPCVLHRSTIFVICFINSSFLC